MKLKRLLVVMGVVMLLNLGISVDSVFADQEDPEPWIMVQSITEDSQK